MAIGNKTFEIQDLNYSIWRHSYYKIGANYAEMRMKEVVKNINQGNWSKLSAHRSFPRD